VGDAPPHLLDPSAGLEHFLTAAGEPAWRAKAIRRWLFEKRAESFADMTDLPAGLRERLAGGYRIWTASIAAHQVAADGTEKLLLELADGQRIECVLLRDGPRRTVCISSQVGCAMGCVFCASGIDGVVRNLSTGEIVEQLLRLSLLLPPEERLSHVVVMGMGEPLENLDRLLPALAVARDPDGLGISQRRITISTVGLPPAIDRLVELDAGYNLAVSLHAADDELRTKLVPVNKAIGLDAVMAAADRYWEASGRRLTFEYVLLGAVNDSQADTFKDALEDINIQFSLYSISKGLTEVTGLFANLKTLFDNAVLTITGNYHILISRQALTTMFDDITTPEGTVGLRHWAVDYWIITEAV
jgi:23S rRNA (adenine2503-C2)-methyltransferase